MSIPFTLLFVSLAIPALCAPNVTTQSLLLDFATSEEARWRHNMASWADVQANTTSGPIVGATGEGVTVFLGIPYASPPVPENNLRWQPAQPPAKWTSPLETKWWKNGCPQSQNFVWSPAQNVSEDCLYLNVYRPANATKLLPVFFWIYGGSYGLGSADVWYNPSDAFTLFPHEQIAVVTFNYRVNFFSSLCGSPLQAASKDSSCGTYGISDQRMALQWVRDNAAFFGLDPTRVTVGGESAGGGSTGIFLTSPVTWPLFQRVIMESGTAAAQWVVQSQVESNKLFEQVCTEAKCPTSGSASRDCLMKLPWEFFEGLGSSLRKGLQGSGDPFDLTYAPTIDGVVIDEHHALSVRKGRMANVSILHGTNENETTTLQMGDWNMSTAEFVSQITEYFPNSSQEILALYNPSMFSSDDNTSPARKAWYAATTDQAMFCPTRQVAMALATKQQRQNFVFLLRQPNWIFNLVEDERLGVGHMMDLPLVWYWRFPFLLDEQEQRLSQLVVEMWYSFVATGSPNNNGRYSSMFTWLPFTLTNNKAGDDTIFAFSLDGSGNPLGTNLQNWRRPKCEFWQSITPPDL